MKRPADPGPYPLGDNVPGAMWHGIPGRTEPDVMAEWTGEYRPPVEGEWYLSGSIPTAYRAPTNYPLAMSYFILRLVRVVRTVTIRTEPYSPKGGK